MSSAPESVTDSLETLGFEDTDSLAGLIESETVRYGGREADVADIIHDLVAAQRELEQYRKGALCLSQSLKEKALEAEAEGDFERAGALRRLRRSAMDVYGRVEKPE